MSLKILYAVNGERGREGGRQRGGEEERGKKKMLGDFASANPLSIQQRREKKNEARRGKGIE